MLTPKKSQKDPQKDSFLEATNWIHECTEKAESLAKQSKLPDAAEIFGAGLHCVQDSFSEAHVRRPQGACIRQLNTWNVDTHTHEDGTGRDLKPYDDVTSKEGRIGSLNAENATKDYLYVASRALLGKPTDWNKFFKQYFEWCEGGIAELKVVR